MPAPRPVLRVISVHSVAGGAGCTTAALLLADHFAQQTPALIVEFSPGKASIVDGLPLLAPGWSEPRTPGKLLESSPDFFLPLDETRKALDEGGAGLPCLTEVGETRVLDPMALAWRIADGHSGAGRVFVAPGTLSVHSCWEQRDWLGWLPKLLGAIAAEHPVPGQDAPEGGWPPFFGTVILDCGVGTEFDIDPAQLGADLGVDLLWTRVMVMTPARHELRALGRFFERVESWTSKLESAPGDLSRWKDAVVLLNKCDADLSTLMHLHRRSSHGDLTGTLFESAPTELGKRVIEVGALRMVPNTWFTGGAVKAQGHPEIGSVVGAILKRAPWPQAPAAASSDPAPVAE